MAADPIVYCLTRDHALAAAIDEALPSAFFYNDAGRLHQAVMLRTPSVVLVDTRAVRPEYGDAGLGPVFEFLRRRAPDARLLLRAEPGTEHLAVAEAGLGVEAVAADARSCVAALNGLSPTG